MKPIATRTQKSKMVESSAARINDDVSYCSSFLQAYQTQMRSGENYMLSPQLLNFTLKDVNMGGAAFTREEIKRMVMAPHNFEQELRKLSYYYFNSISIYKRNIEFRKSILDFDWEPTPYIETGKPITEKDFASTNFAKDYAVMTKFFNSFNLKYIFPKPIYRYYS